MHLSINIKHELFQVCASLCSTCEHSSNPLFGCIHIPDYKKIWLVFNFSPLRTSYDLTENTQINRAYYVRTLRRQSQHHSDWELREERNTKMEP